MSDLVRTEDAAGLGGSLVRASLVLVPGWRAPRFAPGSRLGRGMSFRVRATEQLVDRPSDQEIDS